MQVIQEDNARNNDDRFEYYNLHNVLVSKIGRALQS